jgi:hypothetical protein
MKEVADELEAILDDARRLQDVPESDASRPWKPGKWSRKEILGHLVDSAANNHQRFVRLQLQEHLELPGYDQAGWVRTQRYQQLGWHEIIELWRTYNRHLAHLIRTVDNQALAHTWRSPDGTLVDLEFVMRDYLVHMRHHLDQILA